ncbi:ROK family transcriptional regulator [Georgenia faecalis]|uniref:ROK family protein n=1 Tax=Georgenia faecalis TaxID=2483799 RepID=A0ABV9D6Q0_9MICO|nr:ROK family transcriptional regulator [Georgenia faecalis]
MSDLVAPRGASRLRERNREDLLHLLRTRGPLSRAEMARALAVSPTTASSLVAELVAAGLVTEADSADRPPRRGRPAQVVRLTTAPGYLAGVDVGRTHARVAVTDRDQQVLAERNVHLPVGHDREATTALVLDVLDELLTGLGAGRGDLTALGIGLPGPLESATELIGVGAILPEWVGFDVAGVLRAELGVPVGIDNDANLGMLAEARHGAARGASHAIYIKVSTGLGAGMLLGGELHRGAGGSAGELGHTPLDLDGMVCRCGSRGCLETVASVRAVLAMLRPTLGADLTLEDVLRLAADGNRACERAIEDVGRGIGRGVAVLANILDPEVVLIGGPLAAAGEPLLDAVRESVRRTCIPSVSSRVRVERSALGDRAEVLGAVAVAADVASTAGLDGGARSTTR